MKLAIMQPTFNPWLGYFDLIDYVDTFVFLDTVQLRRRSWQVRNKFVVQQKEYLFSLQVQKEKSRDQELICDVKFADREKNIRDILNILAYNYKKAKYFEQVHPFVREIVSYDTPYLSRYNIHFITSIAQKLGISTRFVTLSQSDFRPQSSKANLILEICRHFETTSYVSPIGSREYLQSAYEEFQKNGITIYYQHYNHPTYRQLSKNFIPNIGILDLLYNEGFENAKAIITAGRNFLPAYSLPRQYNRDLRRIAVLTTKNQWFEPYARDFAALIGAALYFDHRNIEAFDAVFILSYHTIIPKAYLAKNKHNIVVHASALPQGKGWSPMFWQILQGKNDIPFTLFEAEETVDAGMIYMQKTLRLRGDELYDELRKKQARFTIEMCLEFIEHYRKYNTPKPQTGQITTYPKRSKEDSRLDLDKTLREQFNLLRIVDNDAFPAFFDLFGKRYIIKIEKEEDANRKV